MDCLSRFPELCLLTSLTSNSVVGHIKEVFSGHGILEVLVTDNSAQFVSEKFQAFAKAYGFKSVTCSPTYPQANGEAEGRVKGLLLKSRDPYLALLAYGHPGTTRQNTSRAAHEVVASYRPLSPP